MLNDLPYLLNSTSFLVSYQCTTLGIQRWLFPLRKLLELDPKIEIKEWPHTAKLPATRRMAPRAIEVVFLSLAPRLYTLRFLIISSLLIISVNAEWMLVLPVSPVKPGLWIALYAFIAVHQIIRWHWYRAASCFIVRVVLTNILYTQHLQTSNLVWNNWATYSHSGSHRFVYCSITKDQLVYSSCCRHWILREIGSTGIMDARNSCIPCRFGLDCCWDPLIDNMPSHLGCHIFQRSIPHKTFWHSYLRIDVPTVQVRPQERMGDDTSHAIWKVYLEEEFCVSRRTWTVSTACSHSEYWCSGETVYIRAVRGILAIIVLSVVFFYTLLEVIFAPIKETELSPIKTYRISGITPTNLIKYIEPPVWRVTYVRLR